MDEVVELIATAVVALAAATYSHFGVSVAPPETPQATDTRAVRRSPAPAPRKAPRAAIQMADRTYA